MSKLMVEPLFQHAERMLTIHMYNPFVNEEVIRTFLRRYCGSIRGGDKQKNAFGVYNGKWRYFVRFITDPEAIGGVRQPPAIFSIGGERGFLFFTGQAQYCRQCHRYGHTKENCEAGSCCTNCKQTGHEASECPVPRVCDLCGKSGHFARNCQNVGFNPFATYRKQNTNPTCSNCKKIGHIESECKVVFCEKCGEEEHTGILCPQYPAPQRSYADVMKGLNSSLISGDVVIEAMDDEDEDEEDREIADILARAADPSSTSSPSTMLSAPKMPAMSALPVSQESPSDRYTESDPPSSTSTAAVHGDRSRGEGLATIRGECETTPISRPRSSTAVERGAVYANEVYITQNTSGASLPPLDRRESQARRREHKSDVSDGSVSMQSNKANDTELHKFESQFQQASKLKAQSKQAQTTLEYNKESETTFTVVLTRAQKRQNKKATKVKKRGPVTYHTSA